MKKVQGLTGLPVGGDQMVDIPEKVSELCVKFNEMAEVVNAITDVLPETVALDAPPGPAITLKVVKLLNELGALVDERFGAEAKATVQAHLDGLTREFERVQSLE